MSRSSAVDVTIKQLERLTNIDGKLQRIAAASRHLVAKRTIVSFKGGSRHQASREGVRQRIGEDHDVVFETFSNASNNHLHVEYDPD